MTPGPNPTTDPQTAAALTAVHKAHLDIRAEAARVSKERRAVVADAVRPKSEGGKGWSKYMVAQHLGVHTNVIDAILAAAEKEK